MQRLTPQGQKIIEDLAQRYGVSTGAVMTLLHALIEGDGTMAQFDHPDLGGMGQWTRGGMTMVGDMFNHAFKAKVDGLCSELSDLVGTEPVLTRRGSRQSQSQGGRGGFGEVSLFVSSAGRPSSAWWPAELGVPAATGSQNDIRCAYFPATRRLAIEIHGQVTVYDTEDHRITGVSQQQSADASLTFVSQHGLVRVADLRVVSTHGGRAASAEAPMHATEDVTDAAPRQPSPMPAHGAAQPDDIFFKIERLAELREKGILSEDEFAAKKAELVSRL